MSSSFSLPSALQVSALVDLCWFSLCLCPRSGVVAGNCFFIGRCVAP